MIEKVNDEILAVKQNLDLLDLTNNKISFVSEIELQKFIDVLKTMNALKVLNLGKNPFMESYPRIKVNFVRSLFIFSIVSTELI